jgi:hypothetical protein
MPVSTSWSASRCRCRRGNRWIGAFCGGTLLLFPCLSLVAQTLQLSSAKASAGKAVTLQFSLASPVGHEPLALQWDLTIPANQLAPLEGGASLGPVTQDAGKTVQCAIKPNAGEFSAYRCMLIGGQQPIRNGVVVRLRFKVLPQAPKGSARILIDQASAVFKDLKQLPLNTAEAAVQIH